MYIQFNDLLNDLSRNRPNKKSGEDTVFFFNDQPVQLLAGEMEGIHWMDIHIELQNFAVENLQAARKVLQANREMGRSTPIPTWFAINENNGRLIFINRLDWRHISCQVLEDHIQRCIQQMGDALRSEGV